MSRWHPQNSNRSHRAATNAPYEATFAGTCLRVVDAGFCGILFVAPLFFGGRHDLGRLVFVTLVAVIALAWCGRQIALGGGRWTRSISQMVVALTVVLVGLQLLPLRSDWIEQLSPRIATLLPLWTDSSQGSVQLGTWHTLSLSPESTRIALSMLLAYGLLFVTAVQRFRSLDEIERLLNWIALSAIGMSVFALIQYFTSNGLFYWFYEHPYRKTDAYVLGSFTNRNHFAQFLVLGMGPLVAWIMRRRLASDSVRGSHFADRRNHTAKLWVLPLALIVVITTALLTFSRGGAIAMAVAITLLLLLLHWKNLATSRMLFATGGAIVLVIGLLSLHGYDQLAHRLGKLTDGSMEEIDNGAGRRTIWAANIAAIQNGGLFGGGAGSHRDLYRAYLQEPYHKEYTHAECGYLQILSENGYLGGALLLAALAICGTACVKSLRRKDSPQASLAAVAVSAGLAASVIHSVVDFVWYIPACMSVTLLLAACAVNLASLGHPEKSKRRTVSLSRLRWAERGFAVLLVSGWMVFTLVGPGIASIENDRYLRTSIANREALRQQVVTNSDDAAEAQELQEMYLTGMLVHLDKVILRHPQSARTHLRLADKHLQRFELLQQTSGNAMTTTQIRDAAMASGFASAKALREWLDRAFGDSTAHLYRAYYHARQAVRLNPLQGEAYLFLAQLCFLEGRDHDAVAAYLNQSLRVRPQDCDVLFEVGRQYLLSGDAEKALGLWTKAFQSHGSHQWKIIQHMAGTIPAEQFIVMFQPTWHTMRHVWNRYKKYGRPEDLQVLVEYAAQTAEYGCQDARLPIRTNIWFTLASMQSHLEQTDAAIASFQRAYAVNPGNYAVRRALGLELLKAEQFEQAEKHLHWCLARRPNDQFSRNALVRIAKQNNTAHTRTVYKIPN